mmetsp:Transcript_8846/g.29102  ORF Transcript_8846/g.29102 Transcript_8846/m.29102 type:complete len:203 (-) Transcript_8846:5861-6469(-)
MKMTTVCVKSCWMSSYCSPSSMRANSSDAACRREISVLISGLTITSKNLKFVIHSKIMRFILFPSSTATRPFTPRCRSRLFSFSLCIFGRFSFLCRGGWRWCRNYLWCYRDCLVRGPWRRSKRDVRYALCSATVRACKLDVFCFCVLLSRRRRLHANAFVVEPSITSIATNHRSKCIVCASTHAIQLASLAQFFQFFFELQR